MPRVCAVLGGETPAREIETMAGSTCHHDSHCALGLLPQERNDAGGPFQLQQPSGWGDVASETTTVLSAVGEVTLYNRNELVTMLHNNDNVPPMSLAACCDGELLLHLYAQFGIAGFAHMRGMFALVIWDGAVLRLVRDPVGARTLFYTQVDGYWAVASGLRALRRWPRLPVQLNLSAVRTFLTFAYLPGKETLLQGVTEVLPGTCITLDPTGFCQTERYWFPREVNADVAVPVAHYAKQLNHLLVEATSAQLPVGEEVGVFLSGGLDSSLITALAAHQHDQPVHTFAISFGEDLPNELAYSSLVATHCRTHHHILSFTGQQIAAALASTVAQLDCPVGDPLTVPNLLLARAAAATGLRVILNGEGGDPCFGGPKNIPMLIYELHRTESDPSARAHAYLQAYRKCYMDLPHLLTPAVQSALRGTPPLTELVQPYLEAPEMTSYLNRLLLTNIFTKGAHHILTKVERLTAVCGLEGRAPLFDRAVVEYSFAIPPAYKLAATTEKWVLKQAAINWLPATIIERPKSGMRVPVQHWLQGPLRQLANELLLGPQAQARNLFERDLIRSWLRGQGSLWPRHGSKLWLVLTLELWLRAFLDRAEITPDYFTRRRWWQGIS